MEVQKRKTRSVLRITTGLFELGGRLQLPHHWSAVLCSWECWPAVQYLVLGTLQYVLLLSLSGASKSYHFVHEVGIEIS